ncbi:unnamed protein product [Sympodiomycopsis kandeliae]
MVLRRAIASLALALCAFVIAVPSWSQPLPTQSAVIHEARARNERRSATNQTLLQYPLEHIEARLDSRGVFKSAITAAKHSLTGCCRPPSSHPPSPHADHNWRWETSSSNLPYRVGRTGSSTSPTSSSGRHVSSYLASPFRTNSGSSSPSTSSLHSSSLSTPPVAKPKGTLNPAQHAGHLHIEEPSGKAPMTASTSSSSSPGWRQSSDAGPSGTKHARRWNPTSMNDAASPYLHTPIIV